MMALLSLLLGTYSLWVLLCGAALVVAAPVAWLYVALCPESRAGYRAYDRGLGGPRRGR